MPDSFGVYIESANITRSFKNRTQVERWTHPARAGTATTIAALRTATIGAGFDARVSRIEWWDEFPTVPGAALLGSDDFDDLTAWTIQRGPADATTLAGHLTLGVNAFSAYITTDPQPAGTKYVELQGVHFTGGDDGWVMVSPFQEDTTVPAADFGQTGYRMLMTKSSGVVQFVDATVLLDPGTPLGAGGWHIDQLGWH